MSDSFFSAYGVDATDVDENPFVAPDNTYKVFVSNAEVTNFKKDAGPDFFSIEISIDGGPHGGKRANLLFRMTPLTASDQDDWETANARTLTNFKKALLDLGIRPEALNMFNPRVHGSKLIGIKGTARVFPSKREGYNNVSGFQRASAVTPVAESAPVNTGETEVDSSALEDLMKGF